MVSAALDGLGDMWLATLDGLDRVDRTHDGLASPCPLFRDISWSASLCLSCVAFPQGTATLHCTKSNPWRRCRPMRQIRPTSCSCFWRQLGHETKENNSAFCFKSNWPTSQLLLRQIWSFLLSPSEAHPLTSLRGSLCWTFRPFRIYNFWAAVKNQLGIRFCLVFVLKACNQNPDKNVGADMNKYDALSTYKKPSGYNGMLGWPAASLPLLLPEPRSFQPGAGQHV